MAAHDRDILLRVGRNLCAERNRRGLTQEGVARLAGMATTQIARMERGETNTGIATYVRAAWAIGVSPTTLLDGLDTA